MVNRFIFLLFLAIPIVAEDLIVSYRGAFVDHKIHNESFMVTRAMIAHGELETVALFDIAVDEKYNSTVDLIRSNQDLIVEELFKNGILLTDNQQTSRNLSTNKVVITLPAQKISVTIKGSLARIAILQ